jgi:L-rhamnose mutarotase
MTSRVAFTMKLRDNVIDEYKRRHDAIWPELVALLHEHGISNYSIFLDERTLTLFAVQNLSTTTATSSNERLRANEIMQRWWTYMADLMITNDDRSPITQPLELIFHMD